MAAAARIGNIDLQNARYEKIRYAAWRIGRLKINEWQRRKM